MNKWTGRMMNVAREIASWSKDPEHKVGAVIMDQYHYIVSSGFNGFPAGVEDKYDNLPNISRIKSKISIHAEANALLRAGERARGCTLFVTPFGPCISCASLIVQAGIANVIYERLYELNSWSDEQAEAICMLYRANIKVIRL